MCFIFPDALFYNVLLPLLQIASRLRMAANEKAEVKKILQIKRAEKIGNEIERPEDDGEFGKALNKG